MKRILAVGMLILTCGWAAWLFGSVDWAGANKEANIGYSADTELISMAETLAPRENRLRAYLTEIDKTSVNVQKASGSGRRGRDIFGGGRHHDDDLEIIYLDAQPAKPTFPVERYKLTGIILGPDPRAFVFDTLENKPVSLRINDKISDGAVASITDLEVTISGKFGIAKISRR